MGKIFDAFRLIRKYIRQKVSCSFHFAIEIIRRKKYIISEDASNGGTGAQGKEGARCDCRNIR